MKEGLAHTFTIMIFRANSKTPTGCLIGHNGESASFALEELESLVYMKRRHAIRRISSEEFAGGQFYADLFAALVQSLFQEGYLNRGWTRSALLSCADHLERKGHRFCGYLVRSNEVLHKQGEERAHPFIGKMWNYEDGKAGQPEELASLYGGPEDGVGEDSLKTQLGDLFNDGLSEDATTVLFIAGCQNPSMLNYRLDKAALIGQHILCEIPGKVNSRVFLSGGSNIRNAKGRVHYPDESRHMKNLLIPRLMRRGVDVSSDIHQRIHVDAFSGNTEENIRNFLAYLEREAVPTNRRDKPLRLILASSTFHIARVHKLFTEAMKKHSLKKLKRKVYLLGTENPGHFFRAFDKHYIKLLFLEAFHLNLQPPFKDNQ